ncbi:Telomeric DNA binding protein 1, putative isoform 2 [Hibiscus syriacus]|uniref:Telomeric DNA binding protein 1, putative isoform 2 n=1 Tax=Hibiscus syriacus TaxID=106335 RepID=A0A6A2X736_HIBSY|nr:Telomeric DNA binding protein 1, putative isoform 2 [Hibiscus syriacus]
MDSIPSMSRKCPVHPRSNRRSIRDGQSRTVQFVHLNVSFFSWEVIAGEREFGFSNASEGHNRVSIGKCVKQEIHSADDETLKTECVEQGSCEVSDLLAWSKNWDLKSIIRNGSAAYGNFRGDRVLCPRDLGDLCDGLIDLAIDLSFEASVAYWRPKDKEVADIQILKVDGGMKPLYHKRKAYYNYDRHQYDTLYKRRKLFNRSSIVLLMVGSVAKVFVIHQRKLWMRQGSFCFMSHGGNKASHQSKDSHVKFSIKSFKIPELYIEFQKVQQSRTVLEAVTALLGGGIRVGPGPTKAPLPVCSEEPPLRISCDMVPETLTRFPATTVVDTGIPDATPDPLLLTNSAHPVDTNHEPVSSQTDPESSKPELAQRRARRPFSVLEVEALVQAVEELGTGRWRDIKLRAFENADHRTYVDLKDKWKTLVHTAKISPQQRRGEPVPQELLDRVLAAHAYWSQHQAKQQGKHQPGTLKITAMESNGNGVTTEVPTVPM